MYSVYKYNELKLKILKSQKVNVFRENINQKLRYIAKTLKDDGMLCPLHNLIQYVFYRLRPPPRKSLQIHCRLHALCLFLRTIVIYNYHLTKFCYNDILLKYF